MICHCPGRQVSLLPCTLSGSLANRCTRQRDKRRLCPSLRLSLPGSKARPLPGCAHPSPHPWRCTLWVEMVAGMIKEHRYTHRRYCSGHSLSAQVLNSSSVCFQRDAQQSRNDPRLTTLSKNWFQALKASTSTKSTQKTDFR